MGIRRGLKYLVFVISLCNARVLDPFLALLNPDFEGAQDVNCQYLNEPRNKTMCDLHMELYFELLQKNFGKALVAEELWPIKSNVNSFISIFFTNFLLPKIEQQ